MPLPAGTQALYYRRERQVACLGCADAPPGSGSATDRREPAPAEAAQLSEPPPIKRQSQNNQDPVEAGTAGASARREHKRRAAKREQRIRAAHPRLGALILTLSDDPQSTRAWARGAVGEEKLAKALAPLTDRDARLLHDRRIPGTRANIDHR